MTLSDFIDMWRKNNRIVCICHNKYYDDMYDLINEIDEGNETIDEIRDYFICGFIPHDSQFTTAYYLKDKYASATVEHFYIGNEYMIVWIEEVKHE